MNDTAEHRYRCEVRWILAQRQQRDGDWVDEHFAGIEKKRGAEAATALRGDCGQQWAAGNRGAWGDWR